MKLEDQRGLDMKQVKALIKPFMVSKVVKALNEQEDLPDVIVSPVVGFGKSYLTNSKIKIYKDFIGYARKVNLEIIIPDDYLDLVINIIYKNAYTGNPGDGDIVVSTVDKVRKIQTGENGEDAI